MTLYRACPKCSKIWPTREGWSNDTVPAELEMVHPGSKGGPVKYRDVREHRGCGGKMYAERLRTVHHRSVRRFGQRLRDKWEDRPVTVLDEGQE